MAKVQKEGEEIKSNGCEMMDGGMDSFYQASIQMPIGKATLLLSCEEVRKDGYDTITAVMEMLPSDSSSFTRPLHRRRYARTFPGL